MKNGKGFDGKMFKKERIAIGLTLEGFADALKKNGLKRSTKALVWNWENGNNPRADHLHALCKIMGVEMSHYMK